MNEDVASLRRYVEERSEVALRELVHRRVDFVYATALRQVGGDAALAQEVVQNVFLDLVRKAPVLAGRANITGWLYTSTRFAAAKARRSRARRFTHEQEAHVMQEILSTPSASAVIDWSELRPVLDDAMHELGEKDREAILLRFFENRPLAEVGAELGLAENSARMRVERALEKLRARLTRRGITSTAGALGAALAAQPVVAAPAAWANTVAGASLVAAAAGGGWGSAWAILEFMKTTKLVVGACGVAIALGLAGYLGTQYQTTRASAAGAAQNDRARESEWVALRNENLALKNELAAERSKTSRALGSGTESPVSSAGSRTAVSGQWQVLADLYRKKIVDPRITFVTPMGKLSDAFASLFALTSVESAALQASLDKASARLVDLEHRNATTNRDAKGNVTIAIKSFATEGGAVYDELTKEFAQTLGSDRNAAFNSLGADQVERALGRLGAAERTVTFSYDPAANKNKGHFVVTEEIKVGTMEHNTNASEYRTIEEVANRYGTVTRLLPADFGPKK